MIDAYMSTKTTAEALEEATTLRIPSGPVGNGATVTGFDHFVERGTFVENPSGRFVQPRVPYKISGIEPHPLTQAPALDASAAVPEWAGDRAEPIVVTGAASTDDAALPLAGIRVLDTTAWWAGPAATHMLACLGADVIKVESVSRPDLMRYTSTRRPPEDGWWEWGPLYHGANNTKRGITLDLTSPRGRELFERLLPTADVLLENFSPRVMDQFGLSWRAVQAANPNIVMVRLPAYGLDGPWRDRTGFAQTMEGITGMAWITGWDDGPPVLPRGACDPLAAMHAVFATLLALRDRAVSGDGHLVEVTMIEAALNAAAEQVVEYSASGELLGRHGNRGPVAAPQNLYPCAGDEEWLALAVATDAQWATLREILGNPAWAADPSLATAAGRRAKRRTTSTRTSASGAPTRRPVSWQSCSPRAACLRATSRMHATSRRTRSCSTAATSRSKSTPSPAHTPSRWCRSDTSTATRPRRTVRTPGRRGCGGRHLSSASTTTRCSATCSVSPRKSSRRCVSATSSAIGRWAHERATDLDWGWATEYEDVSGAVAICGVGESDHTKASGRTTREILGQAVERALDDAGLEAHRHRRAHAHPAGRAARRRRLPRVLRHRRTTCGSPRPAAACAGRPPLPTRPPWRCATARRTTILNTFAVAWATQRSSMVGGPGESHAQEGFKQNLEVPFGWFPQPVYFATVARRHMHDFGTTQDQLGAVAVACRRHANLTPGSVMHDKTLSLEQYLASPPIVEPFRKEDCCLISDGGAAYIMTTPERARDRPTPLVEVAGVGLGNSVTGTHWAQQPAFTSTPQVFAAPVAFEMAGIAPADVDVYTCYDPFTIHTLMQIEDSGFCAKGAGGCVRRGRHAALRLGEAADEHPRRPALACVRARHRPRRRRSCASCVAKPQPRCPTPRSACTAATPARKPRRSCCGAGPESAAMRADFPLPDTTWEPTREFWAGAAREELRIPRCESCERLCWYPEEKCRHCSGTSFTWATMSGRGSLFSWVVVTHSFLPQFKDLVPFVPALVALDEDPSVRLATRMVDVDPDVLDFELPVQVTFRPIAFTGVDGEVVAPLFVPVEPENRDRS